MSRAGTRPTRAKRQSALAAACAAGARYRDPVMASDGHAGMDAMLAGVQAKFPGFVLKRTSKVDSHNGAVRFAWSLGPAAGPSVVEGVDFATLAPDGKLASIVGFIDKMPGESLSAAKAPVKALKRGRGRGPLRSNGRVRWWLNRDDV